jgi:hypothetical protein
VSVYNPIENDDYTLRPAIEPPPPDKLTAALCAMLQDVLTFTRTPSFGRVRVQGEDDLPPAITLGNDEVLIVVSEAVQEPVDLGGTKGTLGVRRTKRITWNLHAVISSVQQPRAQRSRVAQNIAPGVPMQWRSREIIVTAPLVTYWMATDMAGVGSGY